MLKPKNMMVEDLHPYPNPCLRRGRLFSCRGGETLPYPFMSVLTARMNQWKVISKAPGNSW